MDDWTKRLHHADIPGLAKAIREATPTVREELLQDPETGATERLALLERALVVVDYVDQKLSTIDARLIPGGAVDAMETTLEALSSHLSDYSTTSQVGHIDAVTKASNNLATLIAQIPYTQSNRNSRAEGKAGRAVLDNLEALEFKGDASIAEMESTIEELKSQVGALGETVVTQRAELDAVRRDSSATVAAQVQQFGEATDKAIEASAASWGTEEAEWTERIAELAAGWNERWEFIDERRRLIERTVGANAAIEMAASYRQEANRERWTANLWLLLTAAAVVGVLFAGFSIAKDANDVVTNDRSAEDLAFIFSTRAALAGTLSYGLYFVASQAKAHSRREESARSIEIELNTLRPFLDELPESERGKALTDQMPNYFRGKTERPVSVTDSIYEPEDETD